MLSVCSVVNGGLVLLNQELLVCHLLHGALGQLFVVGKEAKRVGEI